MASALALVQAQDASTKPAPPPPRPETLFSKPIAYAAPDRRAARRVLSSGAVAYLAHDPAIPRVEVRLCFRAGAYLDPWGKEGLSAVVAHAIRAGGTRSHPAEEVERALGALGATLEVEIGETDGQALLRVESGGLKSAVALLGEILREPLLPAASIEEGKQRIAAALAARDDSIDAIEERAWRRLARGSHFSTRLPSAESLAAITRADAAAYAEQHLFPRNFLLAVSGGFDEATIAATLDEALAGFRNRDAPIPVPAEPEAPAPPGLYLVDAGRPLATARVRVGFLGLRRDLADRVAVQAVLEWLAGPLGASRLDRALRLERGIAWGVEGSIRGGNFFPGEVLLGATCLATDVGNVVKGTMDEVRLLGEKALPDDALAQARQSLVDRMAATETSAYARAARFAQDELARADAEEATRDRARFESLTPEDCLRAARRWFDPNKAIVLVVGDALALERAESALAPLGKVTRLERP